MRESRPGPKAGGMLSHYWWRSTPASLRRTYEGSLNSVILAHFAEWRRPIDSMPTLLEQYKALNLTTPKSSARSYVAVRLYELKRRGCFTLRKSKP